MVCLCTKGDMKISSIAGLETVLVQMLEKGFVNHTQEETRPACRYKLSSTPRRA